MTDDWPFEDSPNVAVFTTTAVIKDGQPILYVVHDEDDGAWQFHTGHEAPIATAMVVALKQIVRLDPTIKELAHLDYGWVARRASPSAPWVRSPDPQASAHE